MVSTLYVAEPASAYDSRPLLVVDSSLICAFLFSEPEGEAADARMRGGAMVAPAVLGYEVANVARTKAMRGSITAEEACTAMDRFTELEIACYPVVLTEVLPLAIHYKLSAYDACYLWLAIRTKSLLATFDQRLATVTRQYFSQNGL